MMKTYTKFVRTSTSMPGFRRKCYVWEINGREVASMELHNFGDSGCDFDLRIVFRVTGLQWARPLEWKRVSKSNTDAMVSKIDDWLRRHPEVALKRVKRAPYNPPWDAWPVVSFVLGKASKNHLHEPLSGPIGTLP